MAGRSYAVTAVARMVGTTPGEIRKWARVGLVEMNKRGRVVALNIGPKKREKQWRVYVDPLLMHACPSAVASTSAGVAVAGGESTSRDDLDEPPIPALPKTPFWK